MICGCSDADEVPELVLVGGRGTVTAPDLDRSAVRSPSVHEKSQVISNMSDTLTSVVLDHVDIEKDRGDMKDRNLDVPAFELHVGYKENL